VRTFLYRWAAFSLLACAAFGVGLPGLDRAGAAALGLACMALAISPAASRASRPEGTPELDDLEAFVQEAQMSARGVADRFTGEGWARGAEPDAR